MKAKWIVSAILASGLTAPAFAQVGQGPVRPPEIAPVVALSDASRAPPFAPVIHPMAITAYRRGVGTRR
jgi:hypothetical protein